MCTCYLDVLAHVHRYILVHTCTYIHTCRHTDIKTYKHTETQTARHTDAETVSGYAPGRSSGAPKQKRYADKHAARMYAGR